MLPWRADKWVRVGSGLTLLLLLAAQENVCPWLTTPLRVVNTDADYGGPPSSNPGEQSRDKHPKPLLPLILRDVAPPRWPATWSQSTLLQTTEVCDGIVDCGPQKTTPVGPAGAGIGTPLGWRQLLGPLRPVDQLQPIVRLTPAADPAIETCLRRTGPPST